MRQEKTSATIFLIGMMACGKSTVGRALAARLGWDFVDADKEIEKRCGVSISYIFEEEGEAGFRARETQMLAELAGRGRAVIATGGGAPMFEINRKIISQGLVIELFASVSDILERTRNDTTRPLLQGEDKASCIRKILLERTPVYDSLCDEKVQTGRRNPDKVVEQLLGLESVRKFIGGACVQQTGKGQEK